MKRVLGLSLAVLTVAGSLVVTAPTAVAAGAAECVAVTAATRTSGTIQRVSATRIRVKGHTDYWNPARGWAPRAANRYRITVQKQQADGTWASVNGVAPDRSWQITGTAGAYRLAYAGN